MEKAEMGTPKPSIETPISFTPHCRSHLKSETYRHLVHIISHCYGQSEVSLHTPQISPHHLIPDNGGGKELGQSTEIEICEHGDLVSPDSAGKTTVGGESCEPVGVQDTVFSGTQTVRDEINHITRTKENELMNELIQIVTENEDIVHDNNINHVPTSLDEKKNGDGVVALVNNPEENFDLQQIVMEKSGVELCNQKISEAFDSSEDKGMTNEVPKPSENGGDKSYSLKTNASEVHHEIQQKEMELEKSICTSGTVGSPNYLSEEGEISGDDDVDENSMDIVSEDIVVSKEKKADGMQLTEDAISKKEFVFNKQSGVNEKDSVSNSSVVDPAVNVNNRSKVGLNMNNVNVRNLVYYGEIFEHSTAGNQGSTLKAKQDAGICNMEKQGTPSEEDTINKKPPKKRKKRAEKYQQLGVKRLKLETVLKPKPVSICRHYMIGRCMEGDNCNFSHDAVPLTKSKPCSHFARHSCMRGDDCPYDHQLSKYPCINFVSSGFCGRRDDCMFSHKIPLNEDAPSASNSCKAEFKPPSFLGNSNTKMQLHSSSHQNVDASSKVGAISCKNSEQNMAKTVLKPPSLTPKGFGFLPVGKSSVVESGKRKQGNSTPNRNEIGKIGNQTNPSASGTVQNMNEIPKKTPPAVAPKGINFLSLDKDSSIKKIATMKSSLSNNFVFKQGSSTPNGDDSVKLGNQTAQTASRTMQKSNQMRKKSQPAVPPQVMNFLSIGNASMHESRRNNQYGLPSSSYSDINRSVQESQNVSDKHLNSPQRLSASPPASGQSPVHLDGGYQKNTPNSVQKGLKSTLAFAAKFESQKKINPATVSTVVNKETGHSCGSSQNDSVKASKVLESLSNPGSKTKQ